MFEHGERGECMGGKEVCVGKGECVCRERNVCGEDEDGHVWDGNRVWGRGVVYM